jgi:hypothetical protein
VKTTRRVVDRSAAIGCVPTISASAACAAIPPWYAAGWSPDQPDEDSGGQEEHGLLGLRDHRHGRRDQVDRPQESRAGDRLLGELIGAEGDDPDHHGAYGVEDGLYPGEAAIEGVRPPEPDDHHERGEYEGQSRPRGAKHVVVHESEIDRELRRQWPRRELGESQSLHVVRLRDPLPLLDQVPTHVLDQRHRPTEADRAQPEEVERQLPQ